MQLGRQKLLFTYSQFGRWAGKMGHQLPNGFDADGRADGLGKSDIVLDTDFFRGLGFDVIHSCDISNFEGCSHVFDLNEPLPEELIGQYDVVVDSGTIEHVFDQRTALLNISDLLKVKGRVFHFSPGTNFVDHGFYMYSPTLFYDYYTANRFNIEVAEIRIKAKLSRSGAYNYYEYTPGSLAQMESSFRGRQENYFVARKTPDSSRDVIPQQGSYVHNWIGSNISSGDRDKIVERTGPHSPNDGTRNLGLAGKMQRLPWLPLIRRNAAAKQLASWVTRIEKRATPWLKMPRKVGTY